MLDPVHAAAVAPAALGAFALAADRGRPRAAELAAALLMLAAMVDAAIIGAIPAVLWASILLLAAMTMAASGRRRRGPVGPAGDEPATSARATAAVNLHASLGLVAMAPVMLAMAGGEAATPSALHDHGLGTGSVTALIALSAGIYGAASLALAVRAAPALRRAQFATMGASTVIMAMGVVTG